MPRKSSPVATEKDFFSGGGGSGGVGGCGGVTLWCCGGVALVENDGLRNGVTAGWKKREEAMIGLRVKRVASFDKCGLKNIEINFI